MTIADNTEGTALSTEKYSKTHFLSIVEAWIPDFPRLELAERVDTATDVSQYIASTVQIMSPLLRSIVMLSIILLNAEALICEGKLFSQTRREWRTMRLETWAQSSIEMKSNVARLLRSLILLGFYDHPSVIRALEDPGIEI